MLFVVDKGLFGAVFRGAFSLVDSLIHSGLCDVPRVVFCVAFPFTLFNVDDVTKVIAVDLDPKKFNVFWLLLSFAF